MLAVVLLAAGNLVVVELSFSRKFTHQVPKPTSDEMFLPLEPGTYWVYAGTVTWADAGSDSARDVTTNVSITTKVEKVYLKPEFTVAVISGYPGDLDWSNGQATPKASLLIETRKREVFFEVLPPDFDYTKLEKDATSLQRFLAEESLLFRWPLKMGMKFGDADSVNREDGKYCWVVIEQHKKNLSRIKGISSRAAEAFLLRYATNPDDTQIELSPGIGILSYQYHHHGTTADTSVTLVEFHPARKTSAADGTNP